MIRATTTADCQELSSIYNHYILNSHATFELEPITASELDSRIKHVQLTLGLPWIVLEKDKQLLGYAYATSWKSRMAYQKTVETTIYIHPKASGSGYGSLLYQELLNLLEEQGYHAIIGGISLPNDGSIALHEKLGFQKIAEFKEVGFKFDRWINVGYWELLLN